MTRKTTCSRCGGANDRLPARYCKGCHAASQREHRKALKADIGESMPVRAILAEENAKLRAEVGRLTDELLALKLERVA